MEIPPGQLSTNLTLRFPENSQFVAVMSDSTGFGAGGTSSIYTVGSGSSGCLSTSTKADFYMYTDGTAPSQCGSYRISWDDGVTNPVHIYGIIPGGQSFQVNSPASSTSYDWTTNVREGTQMLFLAVGGNNENGGSTDIATIGGGSSGCINSQSPSSTGSPAVGGISTIVQSAPATGTAASPTMSNPGTTGGVGSATAPATGTGANTAGETGGGSADPTVTATATGGNGSPPTPTDSNYPPLSTTRGSGGGTVTGEPHLPAATGGLSDRDRPVNLGAIIGGVLGGIALVLFLIFVWLMCKHKRNKHRQDDGERLIAERRTDLLDDSVPIMTQDQSYGHDWFRAEPFVPPMSAEEFARRTGGSLIGYEDQGEEYGYDQSRSSMDHGAGVYGALARSPSRSTSGHGHRSSHSHSRSFSQSHSQNISHSPAHSTSRHTSSHGHSRSFSNPYNFSFTPNSGNTRRDTTPLTPTTPMSAVDPTANPTRPPPSSWHNHASTSANVVPRHRRSGSIHEQYSQEKSGIEDEADTHELDIEEGDIVDIPPTYDSLRRPRVTNPDTAD